MEAERQEELRRRLHALGFDGVRFAAIAGAAPGVGALNAWLAAGQHAEMAWMERTAAKRADPQLVLPGARTLIALGVNYGGASVTSAGGPAPRWARYALHEDYHDTIKPALVAAGRALEELAGASETDYRYYVDTGPVLERGWAAKAGLGFVGKNAMLISRAYGNWLLLAAIVTRVALTPDPAGWGADHATAAAPKIGAGCGKCTRCLDACPTGALPAPGVVDARRCISYLTIELKGAIPRELRPLIGERVYGCDVCAEVCPWNRFAQEARQLLLIARGELAQVPLRELLALTPERFADVFRRTPIKRLKLIGLLRNACVVAGNSGDVSLLDALVPLAAHAAPLVRLHAVWAVGRLAGVAQAGRLLQSARAAEIDDAVLAEYREMDRSGA